jgi:hypothetical protein
VDADEGISIALDGPVFQAGTVPVDVEGNAAGTNSSKFIKGKIQNNETFAAAAATAINSM